MRPAACFHCGLPVPPGCSLQVSIDEQLQPMCCAGCAAVAALIAASGLAGYYRHRETTATTAAETGNGAADYALFDLPEANADFVAVVGDNIRRAELAVDGIHCSACTWLLETDLARLPGVDRVDVNLAERRASIRWNAAQLPLSALMARIRALGYRPRPWIASARQAAVQAEGRALLQRLGVAGLVQMQVGMIALALYAGAFEGMEAAYRDYLRVSSLILSLPVMFYACTPFFAGAWRGLRHGAPGMDLPVAVAIVLAFSASAWFTWSGGGEVYFDSISMFAFLLLLARYLELRARENAGLAGGGLLALLPTGAHRLLPDGRVEHVPTGRLQPGDQVLARGGEALPADGRIIEGAGSCDESALSGESVPISKGPGDRVCAGSLMIDGTLVVEVEATGLQSGLGAMLRLLDRALQQKPTIQQLADRWAVRFVLAVLGISALTGIGWLWIDAARALPVVLSVLVVSCPCALSLATPAALAAATASLRERGFLVTRAHALDALADATLAIFDKTGTLTDSLLKLEETRVLGGIDAARCLAIAAALESRSSHPVASAFAGRGNLPVAAFRSAPGLGVEGMIEGRLYRVGVASFAAPQAGIEAPPGGKWVLLGDGEREPLAWFRLGDRVRVEAADALNRLRALGLDIALLSGDAPTDVERVACELGVSRWRGGCSAADKLAALRDSGHAPEHTLMVGDGLNDVAVLAGAGVSVAVASATDFTRAQADCLLLGSGLARLPEAIVMARQSRRVIRQNLAWATLYNLVAIPLAAAGAVPPWLAAVGMSASSLLVVANALRLRKHAPLPH
jgi:Cu2+-exporting ATPase